MSIPNNHINYLEFKATDLDKVKKFYSSVFGWAFTDYGPNYTAFSHAGIAGGFEYTAEEITNSVLVVLHHNKLEDIKEKIEQAGAIISKEIFSFPGGKRFQFLDPSGNELAVWKEE